MISPSLLAPLMLLTAISTATVSTYLTNQDSMHLMDWHLSPLLGSHLHVTLIIDKHGLLIMSVVMLISSCVILFSATYMSQELHQTRFHSLIIAFISSMLLLVMLPNLITLLIGWDGLGLTSFLLVAYYSNPKSLSAAMVTALTNRIGDALLIITIAFLAFENNWNLLNLWYHNQMTLITLLIMFAAFTKSAQFPFSSWLPAAMAAPTPVSALVHSSTLVTAGVFILFRANHALSQSPLWSPTLIFIGSITMVMAGASAVMEPDLKKIIALSTLSQLGLMIMTLGLNLPTIALFHLAAHALFKALLFISAGTIIFYNSHGQDLRTVGPLEYMPLTSASLMIASLALCGTPFMAAFYSKDTAIETSLFSSKNTFAIILLLMATALTTVYSIRLLMATLWAPKFTPASSSLNEDTMFSPLPMILLSSAAIMGGTLLNWLFLSPPTLTALPNLSKLTPTLMIALGVSLSLMLPKFNWPSTNLPTMSNFHLSMWFLTPLSTQAPLPSLKLAFTLQTSLDQGWQEIIGGQGMMQIGKSSMSLSLSPMSLTSTAHIMLSIMLILPMALIL